MCKINETLQQWYRVCIFLALTLFHSKKFIDFPKYVLKTCACTSVYFKELGDYVYSATGRQHLRMKFIHPEYLLMEDVYLF